jgi:hypothetical protein
VSDHAITIPITEIIQPNAGLDEGEQLTLTGLPQPEAIVAEL